MQYRTLIVSGVVTMAFAGLIAGCSGGGVNGGAGATPENTGEIVAQLTTVPNDVKCVVINPGGYYGEYTISTVYTDVTPGGSAVIHIGPLSPGSYYVTGDAYDVPCSQVNIYSYYYDAGASPPSWEASPADVFVTPGKATPAELFFHQLGSVNLTVDFGNCDTTNSNFYYEYCSDGGQFAQDGGIVEPAQPIAPATADVDAQ